MHSAAMVGGGGRGADGLLLRTHFTAGKVVCTPQGTFVSFSEKNNEKKRKKRACDVRSILLGVLTINHMPRSIFTAPSKNVCIERKKGSKA